MFQPLIEVMAQKLGVKQFNLQVSGDALQTTVIITPQLSAAPASMTHQNYSEANYVYRAGLTSPLIVQAPLGEIDTKLAQMIDAYAQTLTGALQSRPVLQLLNEAQAEAERSVSKQKKGKAQNNTAKGNPPAVVDDPAEVEDEDEVLGDEPTVDKTQVSTTSTSTMPSHSDDSGLDPAILASLGL